MNIEQKAADFIKSRDVGILATCDEGHPHAVPVYYYFSPEEDAIFFVTKDATKKFSNLTKNKSASFLIYNENPQEVFTAECDVELLDPGQNIDITNQLVEVHSKQEYHPTPVNSLKEGSLKLVKLTVASSMFKSYRKNI